MLARSFPQLLKLLGTPLNFLQICLMPTNIKCPNCAAVFDADNALSAEVEQKLRLQYEQQLNQSVNQLNAERKKLEEAQRDFEEKRRKENEIFSQKMQLER